jgi:4,5-dihydroxyphthalate decarboxylase
MGSVPLTIATRDYDHVAPLALGDVLTEGVDLRLIRAFDALERFLAEPAIDGGEISFSQYLHRIASGDRSLVGLPVFVMREFRHRCFYVRRGSGLTDVAHLAGRRVGTDAWAASGNVWSRAILRERGVPLDAVRWTVGPLNPGDRGPSAPPPPPVASAPAGRALRDLLLAGELDAVMAPWPPAGFYDPDSRLTRLYEDYRAAERDYYRRTGIYPGHHVVALRRTVVERHPGVVPALYAAFRQAWERADANRRVLHESSPWVLADLEEQTALMGRDFQAYGHRENRKMVTAFCDEQLAQGLLRTPLDPGALFADFDALAR